MPVARMVHLTTKFLQLFLVLLALGSFDSVPWLESGDTFHSHSHGTYAAPTSAPHIGVATTHEASSSGPADADTSISSSAPGSRRGSTYIRRSSFFEEDNASRRGSMLARRASVYLDDEKPSRRGSLLARRPSVLTEGQDSRRKSVVARRVSAFADFDVARRDSTGGASVPLQHFDSRDPSAHAQMNLQHQLNRASVKLANMRRRAAPTTEELEQALELRKRSIEGAYEAPLLSPLDRRASAGKFGLSSPRFPSTLSRAAAPNPLEGNASLTEEWRARSAFLPRASSAIDLRARRREDIERETAVHDIKGQVEEGDEGENVEKADVQESNSSISTAGNSYAVSTQYSAARELSAETLVQAATPTAKNTLGLAIESNNIGYIANIQMGSKGSTFKMLIDSGSADTWVTGAKCSSCGSKQKKLTSKNSSSLKTSSTSWDIKYGTGEVSGVLATDAMEVAGMKLSKYTFALASYESEDFITAPFDGLMGLAQSKLANSGKPTPIEALYKAKKVTAPVMGYHLGDAQAKLASGKKQDGQVTFGGVDSTKFTGSLIEIDNVSSEGFFEIPIQGVSVDGKSISKLSSGRTSILDTGTSLMVAPQADAEAVHARIPGAKSDGQGGFTLPCNTTSVLSFKLGGQEWPLLARDLIFQTVEGEKTSGTCVSSLGGGDIGQQNEWLLGAAMLKRLYYATNSKDNVVGLGKLTTTAK